MNNQKHLEWFKRLESEIPELQKKLAEKNPNSALLGLIDVTDTGIDYRFGNIEGAKYLDRTAEESLNMYLEDLRKAVA